MRTPPGFAATLKATTPLPVPLAPKVTVTHASLLVAVQGQPIVVDTATVPAPPDAAIEAEVEPIAALQAPAVPACVTVNVLPATVRVPVRTPPGFASTLRVTAPLPVPLAPEVTVTHGTSLVAVQSQPFATATDTATCLASAPNTDGLLELIR